MRVVTPTKGKTLSLPSNKFVAKARRLFTSHLTATCSERFCRLITQLLLGAGRIYSSICSLEMIYYGAITDAPPLR